MYIKEIYIDILIQIGSYWTKFWETHFSRGPLWARVIQGTRAI